MASGVFVLGNVRVALHLIITHETLLVGDHRGKRFQVEGMLRHDSPRLFENVRCNFIDSLGFGVAAFYVSDVEGYKGPFDAEAIDGDCFCRGDDSRSNTKLDHGYSSLGKGCSPYIYAAALGMENQPRSSALKKAAAITSVSYSAAWAAEGS